MIDILCGDALTQLRLLPSESHQMCVTSPPYWGLRDYGTGDWEGGDPNCDHAPDKRGSRFDTPVSAVQATHPGSAYAVASWRDCTCGAKRIDSQVGLEDTPEQYVAKMVEIFREVKRVLRNDGTLWLNLGDTYCGTGDKGDCKDKINSEGRTGQRVAVNRTVAGLKPKDLCGIPWRVAFALQADGWWLRCDIIWHKPSCMPDSTKDRPTRSHEYVFLLSKSERYYYDYQAILEKAAYDGRIDTMMKGSIKYGKEPMLPGGGINTMSARGHERWPLKLSYNQNQEAYGYNEQPFGSIHSMEGGIPARNKRSVWTVNPAIYTDAHFATYPPLLIKPCILAGSKYGDPVIDPFAGSGTTGEVCVELGRRATLIELNPDYIPLIKHRCSTTIGMKL